MTDTPFELISHHLCPYVQRAVITLSEKGIPHTRTHIDLADKPGWFTAISPLGKVPVLKVGDIVLFESTVICEYLDEVTPGSLHPEDALARARHRAWMAFGSSILDAIAGFYNAKDADAFEVKRQVLSDKLAWLERHLAEGPYFAGARFHMVDAVYGPVFRYFDVFERIAGLAPLAGTPKVAAYRAALRRRPSVRDAVDATYPERLANFLVRREAHLSGLIAAAA